MYLGSYWQRWAWRLTGFVILGNVRLVLAFWNFSDKWFDGLRHVRINSGFFKSWVVLGSAMRIFPGSRVTWVIVLCALKLMVISHHFVPFLLVCPKVLCWVRCYSSFFTVTYQVLYRPPVQCLPTILSSLTPVPSILLLVLAADFKTTSWSCMPGLMTGAQVSTLQNQLRW